MAVAAEAKALGRGGISAVSRASGMARKAVRRGLADLSVKRLSGSVRRPAGGHGHWVNEEGKPIGH